MDLGFAMDNAAAAAYWAHFARATNLQGARYTIASFGDSPAMAEELLALVLSGRKRATASLARDYQRMHSQAFPSVGEYIVWLAGSGRPRCITQTISVSVKPLSQVDDQFAWDEGEGDRSRAWWLTAHRAYFARQAEREGFPLHDAIETVFERFVLVWKG
jgi:uncharacterized protein YhfF